MWFLQVRLCVVRPKENWLGSSMNHIQARLMTVWICYSHLRHIGGLVVNRPRIRIHTRVSLPLWLILLHAIEWDIIGHCTWWTRILFPPLILFDLVDISIFILTSRKCTKFLFSQKDPSGSKRIHEADNLFSCTADQWVSQFNFRNSFA